ncbi:Uncharacterised protein [Bordetella ansorpii]|jgi:hypothetical protein|uniref:Lipoprotein n=1 Tax=Bordetella ansorpii TaxID=288768 RepID=A0A157K9G5_9BORD|nr:hypothetical protein [Bordetella ansorpii]SAH81177.1 Uncharacterised protein [Bordetella ansorpii]
MSLYRTGLAILLLGIAQACAILPAWADIDPPRYDSNLFCRLRANTPDGFSDIAMAQCLASQRHALDRIRMEWLELPEEIQTGCDEFTRRRDPLNYVAMQSCIEAQKRRIPPAPEVELSPEDYSSTPR